MNATVSDFIDMMDVIAPTRLAEEWDNVGLQLGAGDWPVRSVWVSLDPRPEVVDRAAEADVDLLITHHPLIFKPLRAIDTGSPIGSIITRALRSRMAIFAAHTNLDSAPEGLNDRMARTIGMADQRPLVPSNSDNGAGRAAGLGRIGWLATPADLATFSERVRTALGVTGALKVAGELDLQVTTVAVCSGSGSSLVRPFLDSDAEVFVTGDLRYHDALDVQDAGRGLLDVGHFASEVIVVDMLVQRLSEMSRAAGLAVSIAPCRSQADPFTSL